MKKIHTNHPFFIRKKDDWTADGNPFRRVLSVACIAGALVFVGAAAGCASGTADTTQNTSAETEAAGTDTAAATEETVDDTAANAAADDATAANETTDNTAADTAGDSSTAADTAATAEITLDEAKAIALADAGLAETDVTYTAEGQDYDNGVAVYEIDFFTSSTEYDYEIRISDGTIVTKSTEAFRSGQGNASGITASSCIGVDEAKAIVLNHAGLSESDVTMRKAMLEMDDGVMVYEFEFYYGNAEYEYTVNATTGDILEYDRD